MALEVRLCFGGPDYRSIRLDYDEAHRRWRWSKGSGCNGYFNLARLITGVSNAQANVQPPKWVEYIATALRSIRHVRSVVAYEIEPDKKMMDYGMIGGREGLYCRVRWGLTGKRVDFTTSPGSRNESLYSCSIRYRKLRKVVRRLNSISER